MIKYKTVKLSKRIQLVEIARETNSSVFILRGNGREVRESKDTDWHSYHDTFELAKENLLDVWRKKRDRAAFTLASFEEGIAQIELIQEASK